MLAAFMSSLANLFGDSLANQATLKWVTDSTYRSANTAPVVSRMITQGREMTQSARQDLARWQEVVEQEKQRIANGEIESKGRWGVVDAYGNIHTWPPGQDPFASNVAPTREDAITQMRGNDAPTSDAAATRTDAITGKKAIKGTWEVPRGTDDVLTFSFNNKTFKTDYAVRLRARKKWSKVSFFDDANQNGKFNNGETLWGSFKARSEILSRLEGKNPFDRALLNTDSGNLSLFYENDLLAKGRLTRTALTIILAEI